MGALFLDTPISYSQDIKKWGWFGGSGRFSSGMANLMSMQCNKSPKLHKKHKIFTFDNIIGLYYSTIECVMCNIYSNFRYKLLVDTEHKRKNTPRIWIKV